ncbi:putative receptor protein kinase ZmPK1 [Selaginella moellendorffii]|uniref:putative receptor protein kinase ZmPK1 n=1 Tax=Selaginella moellendorffii TaxID=88036 RepID=UPI000D1C4A46|nr:putative receptor protein kinase ZmPK1 [Selaginella moellendorffii]|eukprot:XP_024545606.1 putative receptor protein kinase ZmPK1 [Selaginella moellendorffii]
MPDHCSKFFFFAIGLQLVTIPLLVSSQSSVEAGYSLELSRPITRNVLELQKDGEIQAAFGFTSRSMTWAVLYSLSAYLVAQPNDEKAQVITPATVVWRATEKLVHQGAYLNFTEDGNLELSDRDGSLVWCTGTAGSGAQILALEAPGNLVLRTRNGTLVWQSFDHPTDALFPQQQLKPGMKLVASVSSENTQEGYFSLEVDRFSVVLYSASPVYGELWSSGSSKVEISHVLLSASSLKIYGQNGTVLWSSQAFSPVTDATGFQLLKIYPKGELRLLTGQSRTKEMIILNPSFKEKSLPPTCGTNWLPKNTGCSCPELKNGNNSMQIPDAGSQRLLLLRTSESFERWNPQHHSRGLQDPVHQQLYM